MTETRIALDTNVLVAVVSPWHDHHDASVRRLEQLETDGATLYIPAHALTEAYSVLTRLPAAQRVPPNIASEGLKTAFEHCPLVAMPEVSWDMIQLLALRQVSGGRVYDVLIATSAVRAGAEVLLTWNVRDMQRVAPGSLVVREP